MGASASGPSCWLPRRVRWGWSCPPHSAPASDHWPEPPETDRSRAPATAGTRRANVSAGTASRRRSPSAAPGQAPGASGSDSGSLAGRPGPSRRAVRHAHVAVAEHRTTAGDGIDGFHHGSGHRSCILGWRGRKDGSGRSPSPAGATPGCRCSPTDRLRGRATRTRRRSPLHPSAPRREVCRPDAGTGCAASYFDLKNSLG